MKNIAKRKVPAWPKVKYALISVFCVPWVLIPVWLMIVNSMKGQGEAAQLSLRLPEDFKLWENYSEVIVEGNYLSALGSSLLVTVPAIAICLLFGVMSAWIYGRRDGRFLRVMYFTTSISILVPPAIIPTIYLLRLMDLDGQPLGYVLFMAATRIGIIVFLATGFVRGVSADIEEAAAIDGASLVRTFFQIVVPLLSGVMFVGGVLLVILIWNDFFFASLMLRSAEDATLPITLFRVASSSTEGLKWNLVFAHVILTSLPLVVVYFFAQRKVLAGLTEGGVKG